MRVFTGHFSLRVHLSRVHVVKIEKRSTFSVIDELSFLNATMADIIHIRGMDWKKLIKFIQDTRLPTESKVV